MNAQYFRRILYAQQEIIEAIAFDKPLTGILERLCQLIESLLEDPKARASIFLLEGQSLMVGGAPRLPKSYCDNISGAAIGPRANSCGTACFINQPVWVDNIATSPLWQDDRELALAHNLKACWSMPIRSAAQQVLGSFAIYYDDVKQPEPEHIELIERFSALTSVAIERAQACQREQALFSQLQESNNRFHAFSQVMTELSFVFDNLGHCVDVFGNTQKLYLDADANTLVGQKLQDVLPAELGERIMTVINKTISSGLPQFMEYALETHLGTRYFEGRSAPIEHYLKERPSRPHVVWMAIDITEHKAAQREVQRLAYYDALTDLPNRRLLLDRLKQAVKKVKRLKKYSALLYLDVDQFKPINDKFGHSAGDQFLQQLATRLTDAVRETDTIARMGGDEFIVLLDTYHSHAGHMQQIAEEVATKLIECFDEPFPLGDQQHFVSTSMGLCLFNHMTDDHEAILRHADQAMYLSKQKSGCSYCFYDPALM